MLASRSSPIRLRVCRLAALAVGVGGCVLPTHPVAAAAATLRVDTTRDELGSGDRRCSLREAIQTINAPGTRTDCGTASRRSNVIVLRSGHYQLSLPPLGADDNTSGDLNIASAASLTIAGAAMLDAERLGDRVLSVERGARLTLVRLTITGGHPPDAAMGPSSVAGATCSAGGAGADGLAAAGAGNGGGILNSGTLVLDRVTVTGNTAGAGGAGGNAATSGCGGGNGGQGSSGGGVYNQGRLTVTDATIDNNRAGSGGIGGQGGGGTGPAGADGAGGQGGWGGGIFSTTGALRLTNSTLFENSAGAGGAGGGLDGAGGIGGNGGAIAVAAGPSSVRNATVADNAAGSGGAHGSARGSPGPGGLGGGLFVQSSTAADNLNLQNTIVASSVGSGCAGSTSSAIANGGHDLSFGDITCPGRHGNPKLGPLRDNGGATETMAIGAGSAAIDRIRQGNGACPATDQRGVSRPQGRACDIGAYEFATPQITIVAPLDNGSYERGSRMVTRFRCDEGGVASAVASCKGSVVPGHPIRTARLGTVRFAVTAIDKSGKRATKAIRYVVWEYVNPLREVSGLTPRRIDLGVDYAGSGPLLALGRGQVTMASDTDDGPSSCWAISCWPGGGIVVYRLLDGPFAGKYVYVAEHITVNVHAGQTVSAGQQIATLYTGYPWSEWGWAAGPGPEALAMADGHRCSCSDPGGWSTIDGRDMNHLLVRLGAPSGWLQATPSQSMPAGWPSWSG